MWTIVSEFANFEKLFNEYEGFHEARRLLMEDDDEEILLLKEGPYSKFLEWVESIVEESSEVSRPLQHVREELT